MTLYIAEEYPTSFIFPKSLENFFKEQVQPTLTEDERVILRNIDKDYITKIGKDEIGNIYFYWVNCKQKVPQPWLKNNLFQFIKERRRIFYK